MSKESRSAPTLKPFGSLVRQVLCVINDMDPTGERSARKSYVGDGAWHFSFCLVPVFVTTFAPCSHAQACHTDENSFVDPGRAGG